MFTGIVIEIECAIIVEIRYYSNSTRA